MCGRISLVLLVSLLVNPSASLSAASANSTSEQQYRATEKVRADFAKLGVGNDARVVVELRNRSKLSGYVSELREESVLIIDLKTGASITVAYADITKVKGHNLSTGQWIGIGIAAFVLILILTARYWVE